MECTAQIPAFYPSAVLTNRAPTSVVIYPTLPNAPASGRIAHPTTVLSVTPTQKVVRKEIAVPML